MVQYLKPLDAWRAGCREFNSPRAHFFKMASSIDAVIENVSHFMLQAGSFIEISGTVKEISRPKVKHGYETRILKLREAPGYLFEIRNDWSAESIDKTDKVCNELMGKQVTLRSKVITKHSDFCRSVPLSLIYLDGSKILFYNDGPKYANKQ